jgi:hypothetical protein
VTSSGIPFKDKYLGDGGGGSTSEVLGPVANFICQQELAIVVQQLVANTGGSIVGRVVLHAREYLHSSTDLFVTQQHLKQMVLLL